MEEDVNKRDEIRGILGLSEDDIVLIAGSTHRGEEEILLDCHAKLKKAHKSLKLFLAPRHVTRVPEIESLLSKRGMKPIRFSNLKHIDPPSDIDPSSVFILDTIGELKKMYNISDIVFVGGSLVDKGGQNQDMLDPLNRKHLALESVHRVY